MLKTKIMGILNVTPDSFSDGGLYITPQKSLKRAEEMIKEGADVIDVGGESTRPGSEPVSLAEELNRVLPTVQIIRKKIGDKIPISVDTYKSKVAEECLREGANVINSLGGFSFDKNLADVAAKYRASVVLYHIKGKPNTMQAKEIIYDDVIQEIKNFFKEQIDFGIKRGVKMHQFILDPGIGFGKNLEHNLEIIKCFDEFKELDLPLMIGVSRKSHLGTILKEELGLKEVPPPDQRIEAGLAEVALAALKGASIVRTHDVFETKKFLSVLDRLI